MRSRNCVTLSLEFDTAPGTGEFARPVPLAHEPLWRHDAFVTDDVAVFDSLTKRYGRERGVEGLSFAVGAGEVFGYLGPNGAGKTTTIRIMLDLLRPTSGSVRLFGLDAHSSSSALHRRVGYLPGEYVLHDELTGREMLAYLSRLRGGVSKARISTLSERLQIDLNRRINSLSRGNRQKIGLVQAFMHEPELLVLDEPTQGLDPLVQEQFRELVDETRTAGGTVFLSSHVLAEVKELCDRVGIIREGRLAEVSDIGDIQVRAVRRVEAHFESPVAASEFSNIPGVSEVAIEGDVLRCEVKGSIDPLIKVLARHQVLDLSSEEPGLEEVFLHLYREREP
jgi:ABC-2 type transport system ATP-binding protein